MRLVEEINRDYRVQSESARSFRVTIPKKFSRIAEISENDKLFFGMNISEGFGTIDVQTKYNSNLISRTVSGPNHLLRIPSPIGCAMQIRREMFNWSLLENKNHYTLRIKTPYIPLIISDENWNKVKKQKLKPTQYDGKESFSLYIDKNMKEILGWDQSTSVGFLVAQKNGNIAIRCQPNEENNNEIFTTNVNKVNSKKEQLRFYIPRSIVRSAGLANEEVYLFSKNNALAIAEQ